MAMFASFDVCAASSPSKFVGGIMSVPDVFVKAGAPVGIELKMAMVEDSCVGARHRLYRR